MKKIMFLGLIFGVLVTSGKIVHAQETELKEGRLTPELIVGNNDSTIDLRSLYVLVDFWSAADAASRLKSNEYNTLGLEENSNVERISINFDRSRRLVEEIVSRDRLNRNSQYYVNAEHAGKIIRDFKLQDGFKSYLIGPNGRILAVNPDMDYLKSMFPA